METNKELFQMLINTIASCTPTKFQSDLYSQKNPVRPGDYDSADKYYRDAQLLDLLRKCPNPELPSPEKETLEVWRAAETQCAITNARLSPYRREFDILNDADRVPLHESIVRMVRSEVGRILGKCPSALTPVLTGGATLSDPYGFTYAPDKISTKHTMYPTMGTGLITQYARTPWARNLKSEIDVRRGNTYFCVPKSSFILRACAKEASLAMPLQRAVGGYISKRLTLIGNDIPTGEARHRALAKHASLFDDYATIDCSMASDTMSHELIHVLVSEEWYELLSSLRATHTYLNGTYVYLNKFTSMGNGYTFELETVVFLALANVACDLVGIPRDCSQYGDDTIVPSRATRCYINLLTYFGFIVNHDKSYSSGPFRESCGGDYWRGIEVTTVKIKNLDDYGGCPISCIVRILNILAPRIGVYVIDKLRSKLLKLLPIEVRKCGGPEHLGNSVLHGVPMKVYYKKVHGAWCRKIDIIHYKPGCELGIDRWDHETVFTALPLVAFPIEHCPTQKFQRVARSFLDGVNNYEVVPYNRHIGRGSSSSLVFDLYSSLSARPVTSRRN